MSLYGFKRLLIEIIVLDKIGLIIVHSQLDFNSCYSLIAICVLYSLTILFS